MPASGPIATRAVDPIPPNPPARADQPPVAPMRAVAASTPELSSWAKIVRSPGASPVLRAVLTNSTLVELKDNAATLACPSRFFNGAKSRLGEIAALFEKELGRPYTITLQEPADAVGPDQAAAAGAPPSESSAGNPLDDPLVKTVLELFSARIISVQPRTVS